MKILWKSHCSIILPQIIDLRVNLFLARSNGISTFYSYIYNLCYFLNPFDLLQSFDLTPVCILFNTLLQMSYKTSIHVHLHCSRSDMGTLQKTISCHFELRLIRIHSCTTQCYTLFFKNQQAQFTIELDFQTHELSKFFSFYIHNCFL